MKIAKKIAALLCVAALTVAELVVPVGADSIADTAKAISSGTTYKCELTGDGAYVDYKISVSSSGNLSVKLDSTLECAELEVFDSDFNYVDISDYTITSGKKYDGGSWYIDYRWNNVGEKLVCTTVWKVNKGTYYIRLHNNYGNGINHSWSNGEVKFTATYPASSAKAKISYITIKLEKGDTLSLGAALSGGSGSVTWKSSKPSSVTVSTTGKITAKAKGSAIITAKCGSSSKKVKIIVS